MSSAKYLKTRQFFSNKADISTETDGFIFIETTESNDCCKICTKTKSKCEQDHNNLIQLKCEHVFCTQCIQRLIEKQVENESNIYLHCPICSFQLGDEDIIQIDPKYVKIFDERFKKFIAQDDQIIYCPSCSEGFVFAFGTEAHITKDAEGGNARPEALECLRLYRASCNKCGSTFCANCNTTPFHQGFTCEEQRLLTKKVVCRFCHKNPAVGCENLDSCHRVCWDEACKGELDGSCMQVCKCGHACCGFRGETEHFGCPLCDIEHNECVFCYDSLTLSPSVRMKCGHCAHKGCLLMKYQMLSDKGKIELPRCEYMYEKCEEIAFHECVRETAQKWIDVSQKIEQLTVQKMKEEHLEDEADHVNNPAFPEYYKKPLNYARHLFEFYFCDKCHEPFYGGHVNCVNGQEENKAGDFLCMRCRREFLQDKYCKIHGEEGMVFKCFFCCNPSTYCCGGTTYYCTQCHDVRRPNPPPVCDGKCQFAPHAPNGEHKICAYCVKCEMERENK